MMTADETRPAQDTARGGAGPWRHPTPHEINILIGRRIRHLRILSGLTQDWLAGEIGVSNQQVSKIEMAKDAVSCARLVLIARALDVRTSEILDVVPLHVEDRPDAVVPVEPCRRGRRPNRETLTT